MNVTVRGGIIESAQIGTGHVIIVQLGLTRAKVYQTSKKVRDICTCRVHESPSLEKSKCCFGQ